MRTRFFLFFLFSFFLLISPLYALETVATDNCLSSTWPHEKSELKPDPAVVYGRLDNGFRYVLMVNHEPRDRVAINLDIQAGSLNENDDQRGLAHFLEHMLFNGSTHFPPGTLIEYFQSIGMSFGGDINAHTSFDETVYTLLLPAGTKEQLDKGLLVMADYGRGALLLEEEIDRERGVILAEKRSRDSAGYRTMVAGLKFAMQGTKVAERMVIGTQDVLEKADTALLKSYYDAWYRPENMVLVMVGEFDIQQAKSLIKKRFSGLAAGAPALPCPEVGSIPDRGLDTFYHYEAETGSTEVSIESPWNEKSKNDSLDKQTRELRENLVAMIINDRLRKIVEKADAPFTKAWLGSGIAFDNFGYGSINAQVEAGKWQEALLQLDTVLRQALEYGFQDQELVVVRKKILAQLDDAVLTAKTRNSRGLASQLVRNINSNEVFLSPVMRKSLLTPVLERVTVQELHQTMQQVWSHNNRLISVTGNSLINKDDPAAFIKATYEKALTRSVERPLTLKAPVFPYLTLEQEQSSLPVIQPLPEIDAQRIILANGVILNLKVTDFKENAVSVAVDFGHGRQGEPKPGMALMGQLVVSGSGTGKLSRTDLEQVVAGSSVSHSFMVNPSCFSWNGQCLNKDLELLFQILQAVIADPGFRKEAHLMSLRRIDQMYGSLRTEVYGALRFHGESFLAGNNPYFGLPSFETLEQLKLQEIEDWMRPALNAGSIEITVVGDFRLKQLLALVAKYFGTLPKRQPTTVEEQTVTFPSGKQLQLQVDSSIDKAMVVVSWPTDDFWDIKRTRRLKTLATVFNDRLRKVIREKLGAAYSPYVFSMNSRIYPGYGFIQANLTVAPDQVAMVRDEVLKIGTELQIKGVKKEELERVKGPGVTSIKDMVRTNGYWLNSVLSLSSRFPQQLEWPATILEDYKGISAEETSLFARKYLDPGQAAVITIMPEEKKD